MIRAYAIGDVHGQLDALARAHARIAADRADRPGAGWEDAPVVHLGDYVDRGPEAAEVVEYLRMGPARGAAPWIALRGNHDLMFRLFVEDPGLRDPGLREDLAWLDPPLGGRHTIESYGVPAPLDRPVAEIWAEAQARVPESHRAFVDGLPLLWRTEAAAFAHAGIRPGVPLVLQEPRDLMWIRRGFLEDRRDHGVLVVHGHTALEAPRHHGNRVNLDGGAGYGRPLVAAAIEGRDVFVLTDGGRIPLRPF